MLSRRDFVLTAGQAGLAIGVLGDGRRLLAGDAGPAADRIPGHGPAQAGPVTLPGFAAGPAWRMLGPFRGGRVDAVCGVPSEPDTFYFGSVNGGVWKTINGGEIWNPVFDGVPSSSIGALVVAPSASEVVYVGTGESTPRDSAGFGSGLYRSSDAGGTWRHLGLEATQHIGRIAVHPRDPDVVFVAAMGNLYAANPERGVYRSKNGGRTWDRVLFKGEDVGAVDVVMDPGDPRVLYAALWNTRRPPWFVYAPTNGPGGGLWKSTDGGDSWHQLTRGLPPAGIGRSGIAVAPSEPRRVYAVVDCLLEEPGAPPEHHGGFGEGLARHGQGGVFRSDDAGASWRRVSGDPMLWGRGWYFEKIAVDPKDPDIVYVPNVNVNRTRDGGATWQVLRGSPGGDDYHQLWIAPDDPNTLIQASDQGCVITRNARTADPAAVEWSSWLNQPTAQIYHVSVDYRFPYWVTGAQQDSGAVAVRSRGKFGEISMRDWEPIGAAGESGYTAGDPLEPGIVFGGAGACWNLMENLAVPGTVAPKAPEPARADWTQPLVRSVADPHALYYANQFLFKTTDGARSWTRISPDLTRPDPGAPSNLDAAAAADTGGNGQRGVIYTIAPSPLLIPMVWVGTDDGLVQLTLDDGGTWRDVTPPALTPWSMVTMLEASHFDYRAAYASVDRHQLNDFDPYVYRTRDLGATWERITTGLPAGAYVHTVKEDPRRRGLLVAGTERGAHVSFDDGGHWQPLMLNLPVTSVRDFQFHGDDLVVATFGRGFWVLDDITALRQLTADVLASDAYLFKPATAVNYIQGGDDGTPVQKDEPTAANPPNGAILDYFLKSAASGPVTIEILDAGGTSLATLSSEAPAARQPGPPGGLPRVAEMWIPKPQLLSTAAGIHRAVWLPVMRPAGRGGVGFFYAAAGRRLTGTFTAKLTVDGKTYTQTFDVLPDPRAGAR